MNGFGSEEVQVARRRIRAIAILDGARRAGLLPLPLVHLHSIAYFADALSPVWGLDILDAWVLKLRPGPTSPVFQREVDSLVGMGVVLPSDVTHLEGMDGSWRLEASFDLNLEFARPVIQVARAFPDQASHLDFIAELVQAMAALGLLRMASMATADAAYSDRMVDYGSLITLGHDEDGENRSARVALRFGTLLRDRASLSSAEMVHLYVREIGRRLGQVG